jgi:hypothetical protein
MYKYIRFHVTCSPCEDLNLNYVSPVNYSKYHKTEFNQNPFIHKACLCQTASRVRHALSRQPYTRKTLCHKPEGRGFDSR